MPRPVVLLPLAVLAALAALAGCGIGTASDGSLPTVAASPEHMPPQACAAAQLTATAGTPAAGTLAVRLTNAGLPCTLRGSPAVTLAAADGTVVGSAPAAAAGPVVRVGGSGSAVTTLSYAAAGTAGCHAVTAVRLAVPGDSMAIDVHVTLRVCGPTTVAAFTVG